MDCFDFFHEPVMLKLVIETLNIKPNGTYIDATVGGAGHCVEIARRLISGKVIAFDKDVDAIQAAKKKLSAYRAIVINDNFASVETHLSKLDFPQVDGVLMDLGVSSFQLDNAAKGFSYRKDGPLDMRMGKEKISAKEIVNTYKKQDLIYILKNYGEESCAGLIAEKIIKSREKKTIETTMDLATIVKAAVPAKMRRTKNPCKKTFQAIRIAVNDEFSNLKKGLFASFKFLRPGGRLVVITFHSIEDRIVKNIFKHWCLECTCPPKTPICICGKKKEAKLIFKKPATPSELEIKKNKRSKPAKLRAIEKI